MRCVCANRAQRKVRWYTVWSLPLRQTSTQLWHDTMRYDTVDLRALKSWQDGQLRPNLAHDPETKNNEKKNKNKKPSSSEETVQAEVRGGRCSLIARCLRTNLILCLTAKGCLTWQSYRQVYLFGLVGCVTQWRNAGLSLANFPRPALDPQLVGDHLCR